ncbi:MAG: glycosyltransferase family 2 protein [Bacteroidales bacterium]|nr:glycosyltransferase family 2 protein [Bacteroidales bacterium]
MDTTKTAVVILNWNGKTFLEKFLPTLVKNTPSEAEIWVIDNNSTDNSLDLLKQNFQTVKTIKLDKNYGFAGGYNKGLEQINAKYFLLLNSDIEVPENWLNPLVEMMDNNPNIAVCGPKLLSYEQKNHFEYAGAAGGFIDRFGYPFCKGRIFDTCEEDKGQYNQASDCFWISGAALMIRSEIFNKVGGFDDDFFAHQEEIDLCWRIQNLGYRVICEPKSFVYHVGGGTLPKSNPFKTYLNFRNNLYLIQKNMPKYKRHRVLLSRFALDHIAAWRMILQGNFKDYFAVVKAYLHFCFNIRKMGKKRKLIKPKSPKYLTGYYPKSIVVDYYLRGKKTWERVNG